MVLIGDLCVQVVLIDFILSQHSIHIKRRATEKIIYLYRMIRLRQFKKKSYKDHKN